MTPQEAIAKIAQRCRYDLFFLCKYVLGYELMEEEVHGDLCKYAEDLLPSHLADYVPPENKEGQGMDDQFKSGNTNLLLLLPRGTFKSTVVTVGSVLQDILNEPNIRILVASETYVKAKSFLMEIKGHLEKNEMYRAYFHSIHGVYPDGVSTKRNKDLLWTNSEVVLACRTRPLKEPSIMVSGIDKTVTGMHYDKIIMDDLHSENNVTNKEQIDKVIAYWKLAYSLLEPQGRLIIVGTRWDYNDLYQEILDYHRDTYNIIIRQAIKEDGTAFFPSRLSLEVLEEIKRKQGSAHFCNPGEAPILMSDWTIKRLDEVQVGDEVIGFEKGEPQHHKRLVRSTVTDISIRTARTQKVFMESGRTFRCTPQHNWYTGREDATHKPYRPLKIGREMMQVVNTDESPVADRIYDWAYLGGIIDADGACKYGNINISQYSESTSGVYKRIEDTLVTLGIHYKKYPHNFVLNGGRQTKFDIIRYSKLAKAHQIVGTLWTNQSRIRSKSIAALKTKDRVVDIKPWNTEKVYGLTTTTGNYVAWGYMSQNSNQYQNLPISEEDADFKREDITRIDWNLVKDMPMNWYLIIDPSFAGPTSDFAALVVVGMNHMRQIYVRYILRKKLTFSEIIESMFDLNNKYRPKAIHVKAVAGAGKSFMYELNNEQKRRGVWLPVRELRDAKNSKEDRIRALSPLYQFHNAFHIKECPQIDDLEYELLHFPKGKSDDAIDALASVLEIATPPNAKTSTKVYNDDKKDKSLKPRSMITKV